MADKNNLNVCQPSEPSTCVAMLDELDLHLKTMNDKVDNIVALLNLYFEFEDVVRSFILEDNPSLEKQLSAIEECKGDFEPEMTTEELAALIEQSVAIIDRLKHDCRY